MLVWLCERPMIVLFMSKIVLKHVEADIAMFVGINADRLGIHPTYPGIEIQE